MIANLEAMAMMPPGATKRRAIKLLAEYKEAERKAENAAANAAAAAVEADAVAVRAAEAVAAAAAAARPNIEFEPPRRSTYVSKMMNKQHIKKMKGKRSATKTPHSSPASRGGRRTVRRRK